MKPFINKIIVLITLAFFIISPNLSEIDATENRHHLYVELIPEKQKLKGIDHVRLYQNKNNPLNFKLSEKSRISSVKVNNQDSSFRFSGGILSIPVNGKSSGSLDIKIEYEAVFDDPVPYLFANTDNPDLFANTDNPGFGVTGIISDKGCFLLDGAGWRPVPPSIPFSILLTVKAPEGMTAVTAGTRLEETTEGNHTISRWNIRHPVKGLSLSAGYYHVLEKQMENLVLSAFFYPESIPLANAYLNASSEYIIDFQSLFGPYPFPKFAVVENFFPTGYGFASYTLLGSQVLRLPFIIGTSLGHEIAHSWWGNGVYPDYSKGNWSEGLTTYVAEYRFLEQRADSDARDYRLQILRNYATLISPSKDFPLAHFVSRVNPATKVIGYDKGAMFFHMLRKEVGNDIFWNALREMIDRYLFQTVSWDEFRDVFESVSGKSLKIFFDQWIMQQGAPEILLEDIRVENLPSSDIREITGKLVQKSPLYHLKMDILLETDRNTMTKTVTLKGESAKFRFSTDALPRKLVADPNTDIFRKLHPSEIPHTINSLKASDSMLVVLTQSTDNTYAHIPRLLMQGLGIQNYQTVHETNLDKYQPGRHDLLWMGLPSPEFLSSLPENISMEKDAIILNGVQYGADHDFFFGVFPNAYRDDRSVAVFVPLSANNPDRGARKISHYGKYSYLVFSKGQNTAKGTWPIEQSPLVFHFDPESFTDR